MNVNSKGLHMHNVNKHLPKKELSVLDRNLFSHMVPNGSNWWVK